MTHSHHTRAAFTLIELSIVLVIIGLLVGSILGGQSLIHASELQSVISDFQKYRFATKQFRDQYNALPGDMLNATSYWGVLAGTGSDSTCYNTAATGLPTCNGNGDGRVSSPDGGTSWGEYFRFWQHLSNAGFIDGTYTGVTGVLSGNDAVIGINSPKSRVRNAGWSTGHAGYADATNTLVFEGDRKQIFQVGSRYPSRATGGSAFRPQEAWKIDTKFDDGLPANGVVTSDKMGSAMNPNCTDSTNPTLAKYNVSNTAIACRLMFLNQY